MDIELPKRKNLRLQNYDYSSPNAYFSTICTHDRQPILSDIVGAIHESPLQGRSVVSKIVGYLKMNSSKEIHQKYGNKLLWQRGFYDHIIRNREEYEKIEKYIYENPLKWQYNRLKQNKTENSPE